MRVVVRRGLAHMHVQFIVYEQRGDRTASETISKSLRNYGWKGHCSNLPAAYLTGLLAGLQARAKGINEAVLATGLQTSVKGSALYACAAGIRDAGIMLPLGSEIVPGKERIAGTHIADYAKKLKAAGKERYQRQFSAYLRQALEPEQLPAHFEEVKNAILAKFNAAPSEAGEEEEAWEDVK